MKQLLFILMLTVTAQCMGQKTKKYKGEFFTGKITPTYINSYFIVTVGENTAYYIKKDSTIKIYGDTMKLFRFLMEDIQKKYDKHKIVGVGQF